MSREIKFRAWSKHSGRYERMMSLNCVDGMPTSVCITQWGTKGFTHLRAPNFVLEQYTGLKDKNGKEIYEGDIIQETIDADLDFDGTYRYEVYWDEDTLCWSIKGISGHDYHMRNDLWETNASREVIGNIHENPELLGGE